MDLHFDLVCKGLHTKVEVKSPIDVMELKQECIAYIEYFTLAAPYVVGVTHSTMINTFVLRAVNFSQNVLWDKLKDTFANLSEIQIPRLYQK